MTVSLLSTICPIPPFPSYNNNSSQKHMTKELLIAQLRLGKTGNEIMDILNVLTAEVEQKDDTPQTYAPINENFQF